MAQPPNVSPKRVAWASGTQADIFVYDGFDDDMKRASKQDQRKVPQILREHFCEFGFVKSPQKWNSNEDDHRVSGRVYRLQAAKGHQLRIYGIVGSRHGKKTFFVGGIDPGKKSNKADKGILKRAADRAVALIGEIEGASA